MQGLNKLRVHAQRSAEGVNLNGAELSAPEILLRQQKRVKNRRNSSAAWMLAMKRLDLLKQMSFGLQVAEDEVNELASYFVETNQWARIAKGDIDIIRGEKGAGKSAIYSLLLTRAGEFFDRGILLVAAENSALCHRL